MTVNGLAILNEEPFLDLYFHSEVIGGAGAFVEPATDYEDFERAMVRKLVREISGAPLSEAPAMLPSRRLAGLNRNRTASVCGRRAGCAPNAARRRE